MLNHLNKNCSHSLSLQAKTLCLAILLKPKNGFGEMAVKHKARFMMPWMWSTRRGL